MNTPGSGITHVHDPRLTATPWAPRAPFHRTSSALPLEQTARIRASRPKSLLVDPAGPPW